VIISTKEALKKDISKEIDKELELFQNVHCRKRHPTRTCHGHSAGNIVKIHCFTQADTIKSCFYSIKYISLNTIHPHEATFINGIQGLPSEMYLAYPHVIVKGQCVKRV